MDNDSISAPLGSDHEVNRVEKTRKRTLGNVRLRDPETNEIILIPTPSSDPNDPLNWPQWYKYWIAAVICFAMLMCNFLAAGPSIAMVQIAMDFFPGADPIKNPKLFEEAVAKVAYFFTATALLQGLGNFVWVPIANKYGRRPTYVLSYLLYFATAVWCSFEHSYGGFLAGRILMGFAAGAAETVAPITIADIFFLHERGSVMAFYSSFLAVGVALGLIISGLITIHHHWRVIFQVASALIGVVLLIAIFAFPETAYIRNPPFPEDTTSPDQSFSEKTPAPTTTTTLTQTLTPTTPITTAPLDPETHHPPPQRKPPKTHPYLPTLPLFPPSPLTTEPLSLLLLRPLALITLPPVLYTSLTFASTIGFLVALTSNAQLALSSAYGFASWQVGLCFLSAVVGALAGIPAGGILPVVGIGLSNRTVNFAIVQGTNVALVYVIDAYRPVAGEITTTIMAFKSLFGFLLSFYTNPWVAEAGYLNAYGVMAAISAAVLLGWVPLFFWGKKIRHVTWRWRIISYIHWSDDREVGE
ncbi:major facilitator superfamily domain-containing protein [Chaetomium sp. MPI-CAGE-AT-0009]|nr:major facilitator superfamily domain-containing protein [Chaetomium sp. MPI-CAGE-AT-0009]